MHGRFFVRVLPGVLVGLVIVAVGAEEGQSTTAASLSNEQTNSSTPFPTTTNSSSSDSQNQTAKSNDGEALYTACNQKRGVICYGDKKNCIKNRSCTFLGAIAENDTSINVTVLTRVYNPPYDGVNLTVELQRDLKGNGSVIVCERPRFKTFKIRLTWKNKTNFEVHDQPGNETQIAQTLIDKDQLKNECLNDQIKNNFTIPPSQTLALKFYIMNNNTLVSQGLTHIDVQDPTTRKPDAAAAAPRNRTGKCLGDCAVPDSDPPQPMKSLDEQKEDALYEMCSKNTAHCFGDKHDCTNGHNCNLLGVIKENLTNYVVYLVTKSYDPPLTDLNVTLTLKAPYTVGNSSNSTDDNNSMHKDGCQKLDFKNLQVQTIWRETDLSHPANITNETHIREAVLNKNMLRDRCNFDVRNLTSNNTDMMGVPMDEYISYYLNFHLENDTLVPGEISSDLEMDMMDIQNGTSFVVGQNGTVSLVGENNGTVIPILNDDPIRSSSAVAPDSNASTSAHMNFSSLSLLIATFVVLFSKLT